MKRIVYFSLVFMMVVAPSYSQKRAVVKLVNSMIKDARNNKSNVYAIGDLSEGSNPKHVFKVVKPHLADIVPKVRAKAYYLVQIAALRTENKKYRQQGLTILLNACRDNRSINLSELTGYLDQFHKSDFTDAHRDILYSLCKERTFHFEKVIKIAGLADAKNTITLLEDMLVKDSSLTERVKWSTQLALARLGQHKSIDFFHGVITSAPVNSNVMYDLVPDILYTRQQKCIDPIIDMLLDNKKLCLTPNPDDPRPMECGYQLMEYFGRVFNKYPIEIDEDNELVSNDYPGSLKTVREWITKNRANLDINREIF